ncbi:iron-sulfur cluster assembly accessory protein [Candidatus Kapabacteria bacterium]|nr:iron-sulfur cluster assembly accessory protein [Candidatus Kapabacteria bacterium]
MVETLIPTLKRVSTGIQGAEKLDDFLITSTALQTVEQVKKQNEIEDEYYLRLGTRMGGCSGIQYMLGFDSEVNDNDKIVEVDDLKMVIDNHSLFYLQGVTLDYAEGAQGAGFTFNNPNNEHSCGCSN